MTGHIGYVVLAKRPIRYNHPQPGDPTYDYQPFGSVWRDLSPVENRRAYCQATAEAEPDRYGDVEYVIGRVTLLETP